MTRPTKDAVDGALFRAEELGDEWDRMLAAEVRALREERDSWKQAHVELTRLLGDTQRMLRECERHRDVASEAHEAAELRIVELREIVARVEALPARWRAYGSSTPEDDTNTHETLHALIDELEQALRGDQ